MGYKEARPVQGYLNRPPTRDDRKEEGEEDEEDEEEEGEALE